jgi:hypothetical protein
MSKSEEKNGTLFYRLGTVLMLSIALLFLFSLAFYTFQKADRTIHSGVEEFSQTSTINKIFKTMLDDLKSEKRSLNEIIVELDKLGEKFPSSDLNKMKLGFNVFQYLNKRVTDNDKIEYEELREQNEVAALMNEVRRESDITIDTVYFAFLTRDIIFYIFIHRDIFLIHIDDDIIMGQDERSLTQFHEDAFSVHYLLNDAIAKKFKSKELVKDSDNIDLLAIVLYCQAVAATNGKNDIDSINSILEKLDSDKFSTPGPRGEWFKLLKADLYNVRKHLYRFSIKRNPPSFIGTYWLN